VIVISGGPNTNDAHERHLIHHTIGEYDIYQQSRCFEPIVAKTFVVRHHTDASRMIDEAIFLAVSQKKPVYLEIPVNLSTFKIDEPTPITSIVEYSKKTSDPIALRNATEAIVKSIQASVKPVLLAGVKLRKGEATDEFIQLADALDCGFAIMPDAKGLVPETHKNFLGRYWAGVSSPYVAEVVESSDLILLAGPILNDYTTMGWSALLPQDKSIILGYDFVNFFGTRYNNVYIKDILASVALKVISQKNASIVNFHRYIESFAQKAVINPNPSELLSLRYLTQVVENSLTSDTSLVIETGDSWFIGQNLRVPFGLMYHVQMQYGSIGWSVGALLGVGLAWQAANVPRKILALIGDGSFQLTAQEVSTMIRFNVKATIILINNDGYTIEVQIHDGAYNDIKMWDYAGLINVFNNNTGNGLGLKARTCGEFVEALEKADKHDGLALIEVFMNRDDCTAELLEWGSRVARANGRR
jgi:pyruvate decarboxylase